MHQGARALLRHGTVIQAGDAGATSDTTAPLKVLHQGHSYERDVRERAEHKRAYWNVAFMFFTSSFLIFCPVPG